MHNCNLWDENYWWIIIVVIILIWVCCGNGYSGDNGCSNGCGGCCC